MDGTYSRLIRPPLSMAPYVSPLLRLPIDVFLLIAKFVLEDVSAHQSGTHFWVCQQRDTKSLVSLSQAYPTFVGTLGDASLLGLGLPWSSNPFRWSVAPQHLVFLDIDLSLFAAQYQWYMAKAQFSSVEELCFNVDSSENGRAVINFKEFEYWTDSDQEMFSKVKVLTFRKLIFDTHILKILRTMNLKGVTSLVFDRVLDKDLVAEGLFYIINGKLKSRYGLPTVERPLLPNLKRVKYTVASRHDLRYTCNGTQELLSRVFLIGTKITHFELALEPDKEVPFIATEWNSRKYTQHRLMNALQKRAAKTLEVYIAGDKLNSQQKPGYFATIWPRFKAMKLLVFRCSSVKDLSTDFDWPSERQHNTDSEWIFWRYRVKCEARYRTVWFHLWTQYRRFENCDCILLETLAGGGEIEPQWWDELSRDPVLFDLPNAVSGNLRLQYFNVGNYVDGYQGIQRDMDSHFKVKVPEPLSFPYKILTEDDCRQVLRERCPDL